MQKQDCRPIQVDLIRTAAVVGVLLLHAANDLTTQNMSNLEIWRWCTVSIYQSIGRMGVPLFVMLTGALLLAPGKQDEPLGVFFKKRFSRIGLPFLFWGALYFIWDFYVQNQQVTQAFIINSFLNGPYFTFWYLYMLTGLYLVTPLLRVMVANASQKLMKYFIAIWFVGTALVPLIPFLTSGAFSSTAYYLDGNVFVIPSYVGYFVLGAYLVNVKVTNRKLLAGLTVLGVALSALGTYIIAMSVGGGTTYFFQEYVSPTMILAAVPFFLLLNNSFGQKQTQVQDATVKPSWTKRIMHVISENTLPIFLFHMMVIYTLQHGLLGVTLNGDVVNSIVGVPLMAGVTLAICLAVMVPLKKVPVVKKLVG
jgi:surface polysaccharide O-acyltransferase-like enzyme